MVGLRRGVRVVASRGEKKDRAEQRTAEEAMGNGPHESSDDSRKSRCQ